MLRFRLGEVKGWPVWLSCNAVARSPSTTLTGELAHGMLPVCWFPGLRRGGKREHGQDCRSQSRSVAAPATVSGESVVRISHWETGKAGRQATTREPGDLPAQSPNRWSEGPYGAAVRSGDITTDAKAVRDVSHDPKHEQQGARALIVRRPPFVRLRFGPVTGAPRGARTKDACHGGFET